MRTARVIANAENTDEIRSVLADYPGETPVQVEDASGAVLFTAAVRAYSDVWAELRALAPLYIAADPPADSIAA